MKSAYLVGVSKCAKRVGHQPINRFGATAIPTLQNPPKPSRIPGIDSQGRAPWKTPVAHTPGRFRTTVHRSTVSRQSLGEPLEVTGNGVVREAYLRLLN